jgi:hypothetical protein
MTSPHADPPELAGTTRSLVACRVLVLPPMPTSAITPIGQRPRILDVVVGRLLELVVESIEGARDRLRGKPTVP